MVPTRIEADRAAGNISIEWEDGHASRYTVVALRWACPCAECAGEWGRPGRLAAVSELPGDEFRLSDLQAVGQYAVMPVWESGHQSGIYSWEYLRSLCPCPECIVKQG